MHYQTNTELVWKTKKVMEVRVSIYRNNANLSQVLAKMCNTNAVICQEQEMKNYVEIKYPRHMDVEKIINDVMLLSIQLGATAPFEEVQSNTPYIVLRIKGIDALTPTKFIELATKNRIFHLCMEYNARWCANFANIWKPFSGNIPKKQIPNGYRLFWHENMTYGYAPATAEDADFYIPTSPETYVKFVRNVSYKEGEVLYRKTSGNDGFGKTGKWWSHTAKVTKMIPLTKGLYIIEKIETETSHEGGCAELVP